MQKNEKRGFLLSEQIRIPVVVLALLFAFALPSVANVFDDAKLITIVNRDIDVPVRYCGEQTAFEFGFAEGNFAKSVGCDLFRSGFTVCTEG